MPLYFHLLKSSLMVGLYNVRRIFVVLLLLGLNHMKQ